MVPLRVLWRVKLSASRTFVGGSGSAQVTLSVQAKAWAQHSDFVL